MNERKLTIFREVALHLNMTEVANRLYMSQPAVSQTILELEAELGVKLFDRIGRRLYLTQAGEIFLTYVRKTLNTYAEGLRAINEINQANTGRLRIGASTTIGIYVLPEIIGSFLKEYPAVDVAIAIENTKYIVERILDNTIDFAFVEGSVDSEEVRVDDFCQDELVLIAHPDHPWARSGVMDLKELKREKLIMRESGSGTREVFEKVLQAENVDCKIAFELGNTEAIKKAVEAGLGVACISQRCVTREVELGKLAVLRFKGLAITRSLNLICHRDKYLSPLFRAFIDFARAEVSCPG